MDSNSYRIEYANGTNTCTLLINGVIVANSVYNYSDEGWRHINVIADMEAVVVGDISVNDFKRAWRL